MTRGRARLPVPKFVINRCFPRRLISGLSVRPIDPDSRHPKNGFVRFTQHLGETHLELIDQTAIEVRDALAARQVSCVELTEQWIDRTSSSDALNCYVEFDAAGLLDQAGAADTRLAAGERLPLLGVPVALKDNIDALGFACGNGTRALHGRPVKRDATLVERLRSAGALIAGKVGMHELALGITSNNAVTGAVRNPWDASRIPGGSSGGSGTVVAARLVPVSIGTDTGGSVRIPAALCGTVGLRPSIGRVSADGIAPISATRDTAGPLARSVADVALIDSVLSGDMSALPEIDLRGLRLGIPEPFFWTDIAAGVGSVIDRTLASLQKEGVELVPVKATDIPAINAEVSLAVTFFEFVRDMRSYLRDKERGVTLEALIDDVGSPDVKAIVAPLLGAGAISEATYRQALLSRERLQASYRDAFVNHRVDALLFPTTPCTAPLIGEDQHIVHNGRIVPTFSTVARNTDPGSNAGLPGLSLPVGLSEGLPVGLELDGPTGSDRRILAIGRAIESILEPMPLPPSNR